MKRAFIVLLLGLVACSSAPTDPHPPPGEVDPCLENPYGSTSTPLAFSFGELVAQPTGQRWFRTILPAAGEYELVVTDIPRYDGFGTAFYQDNPTVPVASSFTETYRPEHRIPFNAGAGVVLFYVSHILPLNDLTCDHYTFRLEARP